LKIDAAVLYFVGDEIGQFVFEIDVVTLQFQAVRLVNGLDGIIGKKRV
jgi:hypothetical protein